MSRIEKRIMAARGEIPADLVLKNAQVVNVFSGETHESDVAIYDGYVVGLGEYDGAAVIDLGGSFLCPGFIDGHVHIESSMVAPSEFARAVVPLGTTSVVADPHEIANVLGLDGLRFMMEAARNLPLSIYVMLPSCVPATDMETAGARLNAEDLELFIDKEEVLGIAEMMNFPGVIERDPELLKKLRIAGWKRIDGHAPLLSGKDLSAYIAAGIKSDHECAHIEEAREKLRNGMYLMIREGGAAKNLEELLPLVTKDNARKCMFVTDDRHPSDLLEEGHMDAVIRKAVGLGLPPIRAIQMATINPAEYFQLKSLGAVAPGYVADLLVLRDLETLEVEQVYKNGLLAAEDGDLVGWEMPEKPPYIRGTINVRWLEPEQFSVKALGDRIRVIGVIPGQLITESLIEDAKIIEEAVVADTDRDILKLVVIERHLASGNMGKGFVRGFGLKEGALASSVAHDSHNIIAVGASDEDIFTAAVQVVKMQGGQAVVRNGEALASLELPVAGIMSDRPLEEVREKQEALNAAARECGCALRDPFMQMAFLALPVIPSLKLTDKGLVDAEKFMFTDLFVNDE